MGKEQRTSSGSAAMCTLDRNSKNGQNDARTPLRSITGQPTPVSPTTTTGAMAQVGQSNNSSGRWPSPTKLPANHDGTPVESFELEDNNTIGSGGTSWTLRVPWLRNKRRRRHRHDDENSSIQTDQSRSIIGKPGAPVVGVEDTEAVYYGGLMKTGSPTFVSVEADNNIEALQRGVEKDGLIRDSPKSPRRSKRTRSKSKHKGLHSSRKGSSSSSLNASLENDKNLLPQHTTTPTPPLHSNTNTTPSAAVAGANSNTAESSGSRRKFFLSNTPGLEPKNNNKVFRNRSWISTSSRESEGGGRRRTRHRGSEDDSLADFDEAEWTPQDSAYGAAIPVCGWVPKRLRQGIEATLIAFVIFALVYWIVTTSISVSEGKGDGSYSSYNDSRSNALEVDDDWYVEFSQMQNDEDDYFNNERDNNNNHGG